jgi:hypothetical protein
MKGYYHLGSSISLGNLLSYIYNYQIVSSSFARDHGPQQQGPCLISDFVSYMPSSISTQQTMNIFLSTKMNEYITTTVETFIVS